MNRDVRVAVVGAGNMGANHARVYSSLKGAELVAVVDPDLDRARQVAELHGGEAHESLDSIVGLVDAASVAVPSSLHLPVGLAMFEAGVDCLIEKPLAVTPDDGRRLVGAAREYGCVLLVGHIERFNPAVEQLAEILRDGPPILAIDARRMSAVSSRITDVDVVADLMIHDLEIVMGLVNAEVVDVVARGIDAEDGLTGGFVSAMLSFANGALATVTASRVTQNQIRELQVTTAERFFTVDYQAQELKIYRQGRIEGLGQDDDGRYVLDVGTERVFVRRSEPLVAELAHFMAAVRREVEPRVSGEDSVRVLEVAAAISGMARTIGSPT